VDGTEAALLTEHIFIFCGRPVQMEVKKIRQGICYSLADNFCSD
jgi:hypothetical protein